MNESITVKELKTKQRELNHYLAIVIGRKLLEFQEETGVSIKGIQVSFENVTAMGDDTETLLLSGVSTELTL